MKKEDRMDPILDEKCVYMNNFMSHANQNANAYFCNGQQLGG